MLFYQIYFKVYDRRTPRIPENWAPWVGCDGVCGAGQTKQRTRDCTCAQGAECFDCPVGVLEIQNCTSTSLCDFGEWTDYGNCVYHSG